MTTHSITVTVNGSREYLAVPSHMTLLQMLRERLALTGTKNSCEAGECGACTVLVDGEPVNSCMMLAVEADGREVTTVEGLADWRGLHPIQQAFIEEDALQCGYCTPGFLIATKALLDREPNPREERIRAWLAGNLCRCTGYDKIVRAVQSAAARLAEQGQEVGA